jgi:hypothetical protein
VAGYVYSVKDNDLFVNLYMSNNVNTSVKNGDVKLSVDTNYPWDGEVTLVLKEAPKKGFELKLRIPGWVRNEVVPSDLYTYADKVTPGYSVKVNGVEVHTMLNDGYFCIKRKWKAGDKVELSMEVIPRVVKANPLVKDNEGRIAVEKGPIVYCAEWADNPGINVREAVVDKNPSLVVKRDPNKLYGIDEIIVDGSDLVLIPYYAWNHRGAGDMSVWIRIK